MLAAFKEQKKLGIFFLLSRQFPNAVFVRVQSEIPVISIPDGCTLSFKRAHGCASSSLTPGAGSVCSVLAVSRMFLVRSKEQAMAKSSPATKAIPSLPTSFSRWWRVGKLCCSAPSSGEGLWFSRLR